MEPSCSDAASGFRNLWKLEARDLSARRNSIINSKPTISK